CSLIFMCILLILTIPMVAGDVLPKGNIESNRVPISTSLEAVGIIREDTTRQHTITSSPQGGGGFLTGALAGEGVSTSTSLYSASTVSNGGYYNEKKEQVFDAGGVGDDTYNIDSKSLFTYASDPVVGSSLRSSENIQLFVSGTARKLNSTFINPFIQNYVNQYAGAFDSSYYAGSTIERMTTGAVQRRAEVRNVGISNHTPAEIGYDISVRPDVSSGLMYADAVVSTEFGGSTIDGFNDTAISQKAIDFATASSVRGLIFKFDQFYNAKSAVDPRLLFDD
ncbi:MAG: hypothetical protein LBV40_04635, partial [Methanomicrobiales archaeon]|nr:hypothetical protein [Methanomicrobiales archaeon]